MEGPGCIEAIVVGGGGRQPEQVWGGAGAGQGSKKESKEEARKWF